MMIIDDFEIDELEEVSIEEIEELMGIFYENPEPDD